MKNIFFIVLLVMSAEAFGQVGIGTTDPQETLDVNGTVRFRTTNQGAVTAIKIGGLDADGVFREITIGPNIKLDNNVLEIITNPKYYYIR